MRSIIPVFALVVCLSVGGSAWAEGITVNNASFETPGYECYYQGDDAAWFDLTQWHAIGVADYVAVYPPAGWDLYTDPVPDGDCVGCSSYGHPGSLWQQTAHAFSTGESYTLSVYDGRRTDSYWPNSMIRLYVGDPGVTDLGTATLLKEVTATDPGSGKFALQTLAFGPGDANYDSPPEGAVGKDFIIEFYSNSADYYEADWDVVSFSFDLNYILGDMDGSSAVNNNDITPFVTALTNRAQYLIDYPGIDPDVVGDIDGDGSLTNNDITPFVALLTSGPQAVPEPARMSLLALGGGLAMLRRRR